MKIANILYQTFIIFLLRNNHSHSRAWGACAEHYHNVAEDLKIKLSMRADTWFDWQ